MALSGFFDTTVNEMMRREQARKEAASAMEAYKKQQADAQKSIEERKAQQAMERRIINEKQIRSLRASFRRPGIMTNAQGQAPSAPAPSSGSMTPMESSAGR